MCEDLGEGAKQIDMVIFLKKNAWVLVGILMGALAGYLYWKYVGCYSGSCVITSKPVNSAVYGSVMGGLVVSMFHPNNKKAA